LRYRPLVASLTIHKSTMPKPRNADGGRLAPAMNLNSVKVYNLSSVGKALPAWLSAGKRKALVQKKEDNERRSSLSKLAVIAPPLATGAPRATASGSGHGSDIPRMHRPPPCASLARLVRSIAAVSAAFQQARGDTGAVVSHVVRPRQVQRGWRVDDRHGLLPAAVETVRAA
jgi:hypothetical protein